MKTVTIQEAETRLADLIAEAAAGEAVVIERDCVPVARLEAVAAPETSGARPVREPGFWKGRFVVPDSFFDPLPEEDLQLWEGKEVLVALLIDTHAQLWWATDDPRLTLTARTTIR